VVKLLLEHGANPLAPVGQRVNGLLLAANVGNSDSDRTGRHKTDAGAIEPISPVHEGWRRHQLR